ncbi:hypothetical protein N7533_000703 [Penicillium manginii]|uniref:uncharacterized protein n=1 Tax=Penicillium manginii TaxID=203109 RepID=UPI002548A8C4|nr:uncharacterized protein N7533_000703 [Penicillium manginii]KAJ5768120.1 hypothetical protein N7533_000703 [Penicillium manginii]
MPTSLDSSSPSAPASPATTMTSTQTDHPAPEVDNSLDDIFGSSPPEGTTIDTRPSHAQLQRPTADPSESPALRRQHVTAGYRDGVSASKGEHVQEGFDAGYPVGAQLGMRAGTILGILEGLTRGLEERSGGGVVKKPSRGTAAGSASTGKIQDGGQESRQLLKERITKIYEEATKALDVQSVFTGFEAGSGPDPENAGKAASEEMAEVQLGRKGDAVVSVWEDRVAVPRWEENMEALEEKEKEEGVSVLQGEKGTAGVASEQI